MTDAEPTTRAERVANALLRAIQRSHAREKAERALRRDIIALLREVERDEERAA